MPWRGSWLRNGGPPYAYLSRKSCGGKEKRDWLFLSNRAPEAPDLVRKTVDALQHTLALGSSGDAADATGAQPAAPMLPIPPSFGICLEPGQMVEATRTPSERRDGGDGSMLVAVVGEDGRTAKDAISGERVGLSIEHCSHAVLPWQQTAKEGWEAALRRDVDALRAVDTQMQQLRVACAAATDEKQAAAALAEGAKAVVQHLSMAGAAEPLTRCANAVRDVIKKPKRRRVQAATHDPVAALDPVVGASAIAAVEVVMHARCT